VALLIAPRHQGSESFIISEFSLQTRFSQWITNYLDLGRCNTSLQNKFRCATAPSEWL